ncbi:ribosome biogenesis GTP-binding protein YihA/YsxC [Cohaesibacter haloalkalitolerans]|uniref:ribosome biogenesis GTP-binding protein YihA/YsxC n=1 Tax=Cohaesibacter haloalkalitolerans TaxID=1162980 RepID=UPI000E64A37A|nr:ribosome biogenesis GTP-binding protein YihA/YsxC [Cohaesibacter haloalkalitolerans]
MTEEHDEDIAPTAEGASSLAELVGDDEVDPALAERGRLLFAQTWDFMWGTKFFHQLPPIEGVEVAFAGRSNVGKSSLLNAITGRKTLARTSNTPGRTKELNFFRPEKEASLVICDMPGYGYAKASKKEVAAWNELILDYLRGRPNLRRVYVLIDSRHGLKENDTEVMTTLDKAAVNYQVVLTKVDKTKLSDLVKVMEKVQLGLKKRPAAHPEILLTSSDKKIGINRLRAEMQLLADGM